MTVSSSSRVPIPADDAKRLRAELRRVLPRESFERQPQRGVIALCLVPVTVSLVWVLGTQSLPHWVCFLISFAIGQLLTSVGLSAHEALHHATFRSRVLEDVLGWVGFSPFLVTPGTWRAWHVQAHHGAANVHVRDPDILPRQSDWGRQGFARLLYAMSPGSGTWISFISLGFFFTAQGQAFLWHHSRLPAFQHLHMNRTRERVFTVLLAMGWGTLAWVLGPWGAFYALVLPQIFGNINLMMYIATNHWMQPASAEHDNPFVSTASVATHPVLDWMHFNFSHHQEHHIFPAMSPKYAPLLRERLRELNPQASIVYPHLHALRSLFGRSPLYSEDGQRFLTPQGTGVLSATELRHRLEEPGVPGVTTSPSV
ncbi:MAG: fatty acid desaturase [Cystobacter sp.]